MLMTDVGDEIHQHPVVTNIYVAKRKHTRMCKDTFQQHPQQWFQNYDRWVRLGPNLKNSFWYDQSNEIVF